MPLWFFGERLRQLRHARNLTQTDLAHRLGLARPGYISNLESGRKAPSLELVVRIADFFGVTADDLLRADRVNILPQAVELVQQNGASHPPRLFGVKLRYLRLQHDVLQIDLAHELGLARQGYISNLETGRKDPSLDLVVRIAERFNIPTDYLLRDSIPVEAVRGPHQDSGT